MKTNITVAILLFFILIVHADVFASNDSYINELLSKSHDMYIYDNRTWDVLMLYKDVAFRKKHSLVDDKKYFLSPDGKTDPKSEFDATLKSMFTVDDNITDDNHTLCRFPARSKFIISALDIDVTKLPAVVCTDYDKFITELDPTSLTLVFPFLYIENPVSIFGHTLLRINNSKNNPLLSYGITYAATGTETAAKPMLLLGGFTGYFDGVFSIKKYYQTVFDYSNIDKRDTWEYELNFTPEEVRKLTDHLWELGNIKIDYFFLDENCSYHLLLLLESARPSLRLANSVLWEIPSDTVRVVRENGLIADINFRPSHTNVIESITATMPSETVELANDVAYKILPITAITDSHYPDRLKVAMLDLATELVKFKAISSGDLDTDITEYQEMTIKVLQARSRYKIKSDYKITEGTKPEDGHKPSRVLLGVGASNNTIYTEAGFRFAFHSLEDIDVGFIKNSKIVLLDTTINYNISDNYFKFKDFTLFGIGAYIPFTRLAKRLSFKLDIGGVDKRFKNYNNYFTPYISGGAGMTFKMFDGAYFYFMGDIDLSFGKPYSYYFGVGFGADVGMSISYKYGKVILAGSYLIYPFNTGLGQVAKASISYTLPISQNNMLIAKFERSLQWTRYTSDISLKWGFYF